MDELQLPQPTAFEWDKFNAAKIRLKHGITSEEAEQPFFNDPYIQVDPKHSSAEKRYQLLGKNNAGKVLFIAFTIRKDKIRIISARGANTKERTSYDQKT